MANGSAFGRSTLDEEKVDDETLRASPEVALERKVEAEERSRPEPAWQARGGPVAREPTSAKHQISDHSVWPPVVALALLLIAVGILRQPAIAVIGVAVLVAALVGWAWESWSP